MTLAPELLAVLACPVCRGSLDVAGETEGLCCSKCAVVYPVREEIPVMLAEEAIPAREWERGRREADPAAPCAAKSTGETG
ncbi:Trm112 family protein [Desulfovibrio sp. OttesenSCG-928-O18]|nr:Trm112 family protein [Desulfovibrio sp. OttesenSCG-928-O18]